MEKKISLILVSRSWKGVRTLKSRGVFTDLRKAKFARAQLRSTPGARMMGAEYRICGPRQLKILQKEIYDEMIIRRKLAVKKSIATRKKNGTKPNFILCPNCRTKSKKLYSEMGGLQTRRCKNGHMFEYDKWIADRAFWGPILGNGSIQESAYSKLKGR